jgi:hypothetical protein
MKRNEKILKDYFLTIHKIISRGLKMSIKGIKRFMKHGFPDDQTREGFLDYVETTALMLETHHLTEDDVAFPYFKDSLPDTHFTWLVEDHDLINGFLVDLDRSIESIENQENVKHELQALKETLIKIRKRWNMHKGLEKREFINLIDLQTTHPERLKLVDQFFAYNDPLIEPYHLTVPFMLFNLKQKDREQWMKGFSAERLERLESEEWIAEYRGMKPYFLEY